MGVVAFKFLELGKDFPQPGQLLLFEFDLLRQTRAHLAVFGFEFKEA